ncbi:MAG: beta-lactamase family protein [Alphaproteobacteria bacterium]|nr:MAG: beta-lactamase family protein [Alphaproteobacteria bacterium]
MIFFCFANLDQLTNTEGLSDYIENLEDQFKDKIGGAVAVVYKGQVIYKKTFGQTKLEDGKPITSKTVFSIASCTKPIVSTAVAMLIKQKKLRLNDTVTFFKKNQPVKVEHLLAHTTGYVFDGETDGKRNNNRMIEKGVPRLQLLKILKNSPQEFKPGEKYSYNNITFSLIENIIKSSTKKNWKYAVAELLDSLDINDYAFGCPENDETIAYPHSIKSEQFQTEVETLPVKRPHHESVGSAGGLFMSLDGMIKFLKLHMGYAPHVLTKKDLKKFHEPRISTSSDWFMTTWPIPREEFDLSYGLGWRIFDYKNDPLKKNRIVFSMGYLRGMLPFIGFLPNHEIGIVILLNQDYYNFSLEQGLGFLNYFVSKSTSNCKI